MKLIVILVGILCFGFTSSIVEQDSPIVYKRYFEVTTVFNQGSELPQNFYFTMVMDLRVSQEQNRILLSGITFDPTRAHSAHREAVEWVLFHHAHLKIFIPDSSEGMSLIYLEPSIRKRIVSSQSDSFLFDPSSSSSNIQPEMLEVLPPHLSPHPKRRKTE